MGKAVPLVFGVVLLVYAVFDLLAAPKEQVRGLPKIGWFVVVVLVPVIGPLLWVFLGQTKNSAPPAPPSSGSWHPPRSPKGPDDDPDYLRGL